MDHFCMKCGLVPEKDVKKDQFIEEVGYMWHKCPGGKGVLVEVYTSVDIFKAYDKLTELLLGLLMSGSKPTHEQLDCAYELLTSAPTIRPVEVGAFLRYLSKPEVAAVEKGRSGKK